MKTLVVGSVALDTVKTLEGESEEALGGSAVYFSLSASQFVPVSVIGVVGKDFPREHKEMLSSRGIDLSGFQEVSGKTFRWVGRFGHNLNKARTLATHLNVFKDFNPKLSPDHARHEVVFLANIDPDLQSLVLDQMRGKAVVACDSMNYWIESKPDALQKLLKRVDIFFANEEEAKKLTHKSNALKAASTIASWGPSVVVLKKGEHGAVLLYKERYYAYPAYPLDTVKDPTGAGDTFAGGFMGYLASCRGFHDLCELRRAMAYGTVMASHTVQDFSTKALERLQRAHIEERLEDYLDRLSIPRGSLAAR